MQQSVDDAIESMVLADLAKSKPEMPEEEHDFGFYYPADYVLDTWEKYRRHGTLPEAGAYNDQDPLLVQHDWNILSERYNRFLALHADEHQTIQAPKASEDWQSLL